MTFITCWNATGTILCWIEFSTTEGFRCSSWTQFLICRFSELQMGNVRKWHLMLIRIHLRGRNQRTSESLAWDMSLSLSLHWCYDDQRKVSMTHIFKRKLIALAHSVLGELMTSSRSIFCIFLAANCLVVGSCFTGPCVLDVYRWTSVKFDVSTLWFKKRVHSNFSRTLTVTVQLIFVSLVLAGEGNLISPFFGELRFIYFFEFFMVFHVLKAVNVRLMVNKIAACA